MDKFIREYNTPGLDCIVYQDHKMLFRYFAGMRDIENNKKMDGNELYLIFSIPEFSSSTGSLKRQRSFLKENSRRILRMKARLIHCPRR